MEEQQEMQQPEIRSSPYQSPMYNYGASIITLTNPESEVYKLELTLRNMVLDERGNARKLGDPLMNDAGISSVLGITQTILNQVTIMSNLSKNEIPALMLFLNDSICMDLMQNRKAYEIKKSGTRSKIFFTVMTYCFIAQKRAFEEGDRRFWKGSQQDIRTEVVQAGDSKKSFAKALMGWGK